MWDFFCLESKTIFESIIRQNKLLTLITHVDLYFTDYLEDFFLCLHFSIKCGTHTGAKLQLLSKQSILMKTWQYTYLNFHAKNPDFDFQIRKFLSQFNFRTKNRVSSECVPYKVHNLKISKKSLILQNYHILARKLLFSTAE